MTGSQRFTFTPTTSSIVESLLSGENENSNWFHFTKLNIKAYLLSSMSK